MISLPIPLSPSTQRPYNMISLTYHSSISLLSLSVTNFAPFSNFTLWMTLSGPYTLGPKSIYRSTMLTAGTDPLLQTVTNVKFRKKAYQK